MTASQSLRRTGFSAVLCLCGIPVALGSEEAELPLAPTPAERGAVPVAVPDHSSDPAVAVDCQCRRCRSATRRTHRWFGWFRHSASDSIAEHNAMCSGCNVNPEPPFGASYHVTMQAQIAKGEAALMVLHHFDFVPCQGELTSRGRVRLQQLARRALHNPFPIVIEASPHDPDLDAARHAAVVWELALMPALADRVVIGPSPARGMDGLDAELTHLNLLRLTGGGVGQAPTGGAATAVPTPR